MAKERSTMTVADVKAQLLNQGKEEGRKKSSVKAPPLPKPEDGDVTETEALDEALDDADAPVTVEEGRREAIISPARPASGGVVPRKKV